MTARPRLVPPDAVPVIRGGSGAASWVRMGEGNRAGGIEEKTGMSLAPVSSFVFGLPPKASQFVEHQEYS